MKAQHLIALVLVCLVLCGIGWTMKQRTQSDWSGGSHSVGDKIYPDFKINDVRKVVIVNKDKKTTIAKGNDTWTVKSHHSYHADFVKVADFLRQVMELKVMQAIEIGEPDYGRLELNAADSGSDNVGTDVTFYDQSEGVLSRIRLGKNHMRKSEGSGGQFGGGSWPDGRYILNPQSKRVALVSETFSAVKADDVAWLDKTFVKIDKIKSAQLQLGADVLWQVGREKEADSLALKGEVAADEEVDSSKLSNIDSAFRYASFKEIGGAKGGAKPNAQVFTAETFDGISYTVNIGKKNDAGDYPIAVDVSYTQPSAPAEVEGESENDKKKRQEEYMKSVVEAKKKAEDESSRLRDWVYLVAGSTLDKVVVERTALVKKKAKPEADADAKAAKPSGPAGPQLPEGSNKAPTP